MVVVRIQLPDEDLSEPTNEETYLKSATELAESKVKFQVQAFTLILEFKLLPLSEKTYFDLETYSVSIDVVLYLYFEYV